MAVAFSSTTHALRSEPYYLITLFGIGIATVIMLLWSTWLFYGSVYHYVNSQQVDIMLEPQPVWRIPDSDHRVKGFRQYTITAYFTPQDIRRIHAKQTAALYVEGSSTLPSRPFKLEVKDVYINRGIVRLSLEVPQESSRETQIMDGKSRVEIAVLRQSPAAFLFHTVTR